MGHSGLWKGIDHTMRCVGVKVGMLGKTFAKHGLCTSNLHTKIKHALRSILSSCSLERRSPVRKAVEGALILLGREMEVSTDKRELRCLYSETGLATYEIVKVSSMLTSTLLRGKTSNCKVTRHLYCKARSR